MPPRSRQRGRQAEADGHSAETLPSPAHDSRSGEAMSEASPTPDGPSVEPVPSPSSAPSFITCIVTPKLSFSLPNKGWPSTGSIDQADLRAAFLARFPLAFDAERITFTPVGARESPPPERVVFKISARARQGAGDVDDERVLLEVLSLLDKAYAEKHRQQLEAARADLVSSSISFETVAEEIRRAQAAAAKEVTALKDQASSSQKRLYLLELEKEQLQAARTSAHTANAGLRRQVDELAAENLALRSRVDGLEALVADLVANTAGRAGGATPVSAPAPRAEACVQTADPAADLVASMSAWLLQGSAILLQGSSVADPARPAGAGGSGPLAAAAAPASAESDSPRAPA